MKIKLLSYNISHGIDYSCATGDIERWDKVDLQRLSTYIRSLSADIAALQEVYDGKSPETQNQTLQIAKAAGFPYHAFAKGTTFPWGDTIGNCILSQYPILQLESIPVLTPTEEERDPLETQWFEDRVILKTTVDAGVPIDVITTHFGLNPSEKQRMEQALTRVIENCRHPVILMGDFNATPHSAVLSPYYARLQSAADLTGQTDLPTFSSYAPDKTLDYLFVSKQVQVTAYTVREEILSDHLALTAEICI